LTGRCGADGAGAEAGAWSVADGRVEGGTNYGDVVVLFGLDETFDGLEVGEAGDASEGPLSFVRGSVSCCDRN
jgi:hypothetical protein